MKFTRHALFALALLSVAIPSAARELSGEVAYRERIALPSGAMLMVEARRPDGSIAASVMQAVDGGQVPLPFSLTLPAEAGAVTLRAAIVTGADIRWISAPVAVPDAATDALIGPVPLMAWAPSGAPRGWRCGDMSVALSFGPDSARMRVGANYVDLVQAESASGARYEAQGDSQAGQSTWVWSKGGEITIAWRGELLATCMPDLGVSPPFRASGVEPSWALVAEPGTFTFTLPDQPAVTGVLSTPKEPAPGVRHFHTADDALKIGIEDRICRNAATGMPAPMTVSASYNGVDYHGCGGESDILLQGPARRILSLGGGPVDPSFGAEVVFAGGLLSGKAACNRFTGRYTLTSEGLKLLPAGVTMMMCPPLVMEAEAKVLAVLGKVDRFDFDEDGTLKLIGGDKVLLTAR